MFQIPATSILSPFKIEIHEKWLDKLNLTIEELNQDEDALISDKED